MRFMAGTTESPGGAATTMRADVERILEMIRPMVQADGGDVELVDVSAEGVVQVRFRGECVGCPSSSMTLQTGIERNLKRYVPQVTAVLAVG
jgi:Fe-S cluster biogenesis protein NfuA